MSAYLSLLAAQAPGDLLAVALATALGLAPGLVLATALARRLGWGWEAAVPLSFALSVAAAGIASLAGMYAHAGVWAGVGVFALAAAAMTAGGVVLSRDAAPMPDPDVPGLAFGFAAALLAFLERPWFKTGADTWYHLAAVRSLLERDELIVTDPFHGSVISTPDPGSGVVHTMLALWSRLTTIDPAGLLVGLGVVGAAVLALAFYALVKRLSGCRWAALTAAAAWLLLNQLGDLRAISYPNRLTIALVMLGTLALTELLARPSRAAGAVAVLCGVTAGAVHAGNAQFFYLTGGAFAFWGLADGLIARRRDGRWDFGPGLAVVGVLAATVVLSLPFLLPRIGVVNSSGMVGSEAAVINPDLFALGPFVVTRPGRYFDGGTIAFVVTSALALFMAGWAAVRRDRVTVAAFALASMPALLLFDPPVTTVLVRYSYYNMWRMSLLMGFTAYVALAWALARPRASGGRSQAIALAGVLVFAVAASAAQPLAATWTGYRLKGYADVWETRRIDVRQRWGEADLERIRAEFGGRYPMVAGDVDSTYLLAGLMPARILAGPRRHYPLAIQLTTGPQRRMDVEALMRGSATEAQRRAVLAKWDVDYVFLWLGSGRPQEAAAYDSMKRQTALFESVLVTPRLALLRIRR